eukprot:scaffold2253_cov69-Phaeocystis_antarctica.AAC.2
MRSFEAPRLHSTPMVTSKSNSPPSIKPSVQWTSCPINSISHDSMGVGASRRLGSRVRGELTAGGVVADSRAANDTEARGEGIAGRWGRSSIHRRQLTVAALWCGVTTELQHVTLFGGPHLSVFRT